MADYSTCLSPLVPAPRIRRIVVKLRRWLDPELGIETGDKDTDVPCFLRQILAAIEYELRR